jgi:alkylation response protein AidB-like acyl-CoA dehydrogenase
VLGTYFGSKIILKRGSEEQRKRYLPPLFKGEAISAGAFTEPDRGSDLVSGPLSTNAVKEKGDFIINGTKTFISFASIAKFAIVLCQTDPQSTPPYQGHSTVIVELDRPGIDITEMEKMGWRTNPCCEVAFINVRVPQENLVGEEGRGFYQAIEFLDEVRINVGASAVGMAQGAFERALQYAKTREAFGRKVGAFQAISHKLAEMATKIEAIRFLVYRAAWEFDRNRLDPKLSSMAKWYSSRVAIEVADEAIEIMGGHGCMVENEVERFYRDTKVLEIYEGTREIHKNTIARYLLGKLGEE